MKTYFEKLSGPKLYSYELLTRVALAIVAFSLLPTVFHSDVQHYFERGQHIGFGNLPYRDFTWEFPPLTALSLLLVPLTGGETHGFHIAFTGLMILFEWGSLHMLRRQFRQDFWKITAYWSAVVVPFSFLAWNRLDFMPVFFTTLGVLALTQHRKVTRWLVLGFLAKLWPVLICAGLLANRRFKEVAVSLFAIGASVLLWYAFSPEGFRDFVEFRKGQGFQIESVPGSILHLGGREWFFYSGTVSISDHGWKWLQPALIAVTALGVSALTLLAFVRKQHDAVMLIGACIAITVVSNRLISPQFLVWLAPFVAMRLSQERMIAGIYAVCIALSMLVLFFYEQMVHNTGDLIDVVLVLRNVALIALVFFMARAALRRPPDVIQLNNDAAG